LDKFNYTRFFNYAFFTNGSLANLTSHFDELSIWAIVN
jgi:hypothetical protein